MAEYIHLVGADDVRSAGNRMAAAAQDMLRAANIIDATWHRQQQYLEDWLFRFEQIMDKAREAKDETV